VSAVGSNDRISAGDLMSGSWMINPKADGRKSTHCGHHDA
jgi:hypothetical protein